MASQLPTPSSTAASPGSSPSSNEPVKAASLMGLPEELKKLIVKDVQADDDRYFFSCAEEEEYFSAVASPRCDSLRMLAATSRTFYRLCAPEVWEELRLDDSSTAWLLHPVKYLLPKHGQKVKKLHLQPCRVQDKVLLPETVSEDEWLSDATLPAWIVEEAETLSGISSSGLPRRVRELRARSLLLAAAIRLCPIVEQVEIAEFDPSLGDKVPGCSYNIDHTMEEVQRVLGPSLTHLTANLRYEVDESTESVGALVRACPNLTSLTIDLDCVVLSEVQRVALGDALVSLNKLTDLDLGLGGIIDDRLLGLPFTFPLTSLAIYDDENSVVQDFASFNTFFTTVSSTVTKLTWLSISNAPIPASIFFPSLPHLIDLVLIISQDAVVLRTFADSPLQTLEIRSSPAIDSKAWCNFIESKRATLRRVEISSNATAEFPTGSRGLSLAEVREIETKCGSLGIEYVASE